MIIKIKLALKYKYKRQIGIKTKKVVKKQCIIRR